MRNERADVLQNRGEREDMDLARQILQPHIEFAEELRQMRHLLRQQQRELEARRDAPPRRADDGAGMLNGLVHGLQPLKIDVRSPKFENKLATNPLKRVDEAFKIFIVENALDGRAKICF